MYIIIILVLLYSIILHEVAHGKMAELMGDPTARLAGRLTLNPIPHIDPIGTVFPILLMLSGAPIIFGWAKPVPINPYNFKNYNRGMTAVSAAGILTNLFIAWVLALLVKFLPGIDPTLAGVLLFGVRINVVLAVFNLIPIPPLDGSRLFASFLSYKYQEMMYRLEPYGFMILIAILLFPPTEFLLGYIIDLVYGLLLFRPF
jgi:Zn-dependent protease